MNNTCGHSHAAMHECGHANADAFHASYGKGGRVLTIRPHSGISGDMCLAGLMRLTEIPPAEFDGLLAAVMPELAGTVRLVRKNIGGIGGWHAEVSLPHEHAHRTLADILALIEQGGMEADAKQASARVFTLLAEAESAVHGRKPEEVRFHEVGALDSILDICVTCALFCRLAPERFVVGALPVADGSVLCAHGVIPVPAPAVLQLIEGVPVRPFAARGETVTPTGIALLRGLGAEFGPWPAMRIEKQALVYGTTVFEGAPNGAVFACGSALSED